ncbi:hypothetical protein EYR41_011230 [Orbilia oligospora]|uniref:Uncharacterized protein n=1 Tax=Orbilia oligospora TaxID=2813651 RepID=A0A8H2DQS7_ORBOL|nr:hypothetical protein EYR41_011230 [Orbilia oligospora]
MLYGLTTWPGRCIYTGYLHSFAHHVRGTYACMGELFGKKSNTNSCSSGICQKPKVVTISDAGVKANEESRHWPGGTSYGQRFDRLRIPPAMRYPSQGFSHSEFDAHKFILARDLYIMGETFSCFSRHKTDWTIWKKLALEGPPLQKKGLVYTV